MSTFPTNNMMWCFNGISHLNQQIFNLFNFRFEFYLLPSNLYLKSYYIYFTTDFGPFIPIVILYACTFTTSVKIRRHILSDSS